jgi:hypothetical protein
VVAAAIAVVRGEAEAWWPKRTHGRCQLPQSVLPIGRPVWQFVSLLFALRSPANLAWPCPQRPSLWEICANSHLSFHPTSLFRAYITYPN